MITQPQTRRVITPGPAIYLGVLILVAVASFAAGRYLWQDSESAPGPDAGRGASSLPPSSAPAVTSEEKATAMRDFTEDAWMNLFGPIQLSPSIIEPVSAEERSAAISEFTEDAWNVRFGAAAPDISQFEVDRILASQGPLPPSPR